MANGKIAIVDVNGQKFRHIISETWNIDITDIIRAYDGSMPINLTIQNEEGAIVHQAIYIPQLIGNINPNNMIIPKSEETTTLANFLELEESEGIIIPPTNILASQWGNRLIFDMNTINRILPIGYQMKAYINGNEHRYGSPLGLNAGDVLELTCIKRGVVEQRFYETTIRPLDCSRRYAMVQWTGRSGNMKIATWEIAGVTDEQDGAIEILHPLNAYDIRMGLTERMTLRIENLNAYDYWYYSDIITSPDVRVAVNSSAFVGGTIMDNAKVAVITKNSKQRDGNAGQFNTLNVDIKYKRYDSI